MPDLKLIAYGIALVAIVGAVLGYGEWRAHNARDAEHQRMQAQIDQIRVEAATQLAVQTRKTLGLEHELQDMKERQEAEYENRRIASRAATMALDRAAVGGVFIDPNGGGCRCGAKTEAVGSAGSGAVDKPQAGGVLSVQLSSVLRGIVQAADDINDAYALCRADAIGIREKFNEGAEEKNQSLQTEP